MPCQEPLEGFLHLATNNKTKHKQNLVSTDHERDITLEIFAQLIGLGRSAQISLDIKQARPPRLERREISLQRSE